MEIKNYINLARFGILVLVMVGLNAQVLLAQVRPDLGVGQDVAIVTSSSYEREEILWLARVAHSESKLASEQVLVSWVVRNRVERNYRGARNYEDVATDPKQFSGLNSTDAHYEYNISRTYDSTGSAWATALDAAREVYHARRGLAPISETTLHFYSPVAVSAPNWAQGKRPVHTILNSTGDTRFAFYEGVK